MTSLQGSAKWGLSSLRASGYASDGLTTLGEACALRGKNSQEESIDLVSAYILWMNSTRASQLSFMTSLDHWPTFCPEAVYQTAQGLGLVLQLYHVALLHTSAF